LNDFSDCKFNQLRTTTRTTGSTRITGRTTRTSTRTKIQREFNENDWKYNENCNEFNNENIQKLWLKWVLGSMITIVPTVYPLVWLYFQLVFWMVLPRS
jgi:hypothetical protein